MNTTPPTHLYVLTGASRGLGAAIADALLQPATQLLCLSRRTDDALAERARAAGAQVEQWSADLTAPDAVAARLESWLAALDASALRTATLINNAAALTPTGPVTDVATPDLVGALRVGLEAPILLSAAFLRATRGWSARKRVLNISSGLGRRGMAGATSYCAVKAGLDNYSRALALDEPLLGERGARVVSLAPGVIDTDMQVQLRGAAAAGFPEQSNFIALKERGQLASPQEAARRVLAYLEQDDYGANPVADVRDMA